MFVCVCVRERNEETERKIHKKIAQNIDRRIDRKNIDIYLEYRWIEL